MQIAILCLTYMMVIVIIHAAWISAVIKRQNKCGYHDCRHCPYDGKCPMQSRRYKSDKTDSRKEYEDYGNDKGNNR